MKEVQFEKLTTLRDLVKKYPQVMDMPIAVVGREELYEFVGDSKVNYQNNAAKIFIDNHTFYDAEDEPTETIPVLVFAPEWAYRDWDYEI